MGEEIKNKIVVVTGGSKGIGSAIADEFLNEGAKTVIIVDIEETAGNKTADLLNSKHGEGKAIFCKGDVTTDLDKVYDAIIGKYQSVDILVNNAGISDEMSIRRTLNVNTIAPIEWSMKFLQNMRKDIDGKGGTILNVASIFAYTIDPCSPFYKASKYAIMGFTRTLGHAEIYHVTGVRVIALCPGATKTDFGKNKQFSLQIIKDISNSFSKTLPHQEKEDVARAAMDVIKIAKSGSAWNIINGGPIQEVT